MAQKTDRAGGKKPPGQEVEDFGEWDTSVTDPPREPVVEDDDPTTTTAAVSPAAVVYDEKDFDLMDNPSTADEDEAPPVEARKAEVRSRPMKETPPPPDRVPPVEEAPKPPLVAGFEIDTSQSYTTIGPSIVIRGKLKCDENLIVSGRLEADVKSTKDLRIEAQGIMNANIDVHAASISGIVVGDIRASELVELGSEARVIGNIASPRLIIHEGAKFRGKIEMDGLQALEILKPAPPKVVESPRAAAAATAAASPAAARVVMAEVSDTPTPAPARPGETAARSTAGPLEPMALKPQVKPSAPRPAPVPIQPATPSARPAAAAAPATPAAAKPVEKPAEPSAEKSGGWFGRRS